MADKNEELVLSIRGMSKSFGRNRVLDHIDLDLKPGTVMGLMGENGAGKSTMMNILGCLDRPTSGQYYLDGKEVAGYSDDELARTRNAKIGFVFQNFNLLPKLSAQLNVALPLVYAGIGEEERLERAKTALEAVGLGDRIDHNPTEMSGGQRQRATNKFSSNIFKGSL